jgi:hypothetical protein
MCLTPGLSLIPTPGRLLRRLEEQQQRRHTEFLALMTQHKLELAALLGGAGSARPAPCGNGTAAGAGGRREVEEGPCAKSGQLVQFKLGRLAPADRAWLDASSEASDEEEPPQQPQAGSRGAVAGKAAPDQATLHLSARVDGTLPTPLGKARGRARTSPNVSESLPAQRLQPRQAAPRKRGGSGEAADTQFAKRRTGGSRRSTAAEEVLADRMAVDGAATAGQQRARGKRRASADVADGAAVAVKRRSRR